MKPNTAILLSALSASLVSALFISSLGRFEGFSEFGRFCIYSVYAIVMWLPTNALFVYALQKAPAAEVYIKFSVTVAITDILVGITILNQIPSSWLFLGTGAILGVLVLKTKESQGENELKSLSLEILGYALMCILIWIAYTERQPWIAVGVFVFADLMCGPLSNRIYLALASVKNEVAKLIISGTLGFAPVVLAIVILLTMVPNLAIAGPVASISAAIFSVPMALIFFKVPQMDWKKIVYQLIIGSVAIAMIFLAF